MTDDGFNIGVLYKGNRKPYRGAVPATASVAELGRRFELQGD